MNTRNVALALALSTLACISSVAQTTAQPAAQAQGVQQGPTLTIAEAERLALAHNPQVSYAKLIALAQGQVTREVRATEMPTVTGNLTAVEAHDGSRLTAGALNNPILYDRAAGGVIASQLITDFGRTGNLIASAKLDEKAQQQNAMGAAADIVFAVDQAFYRALNAQALVSVAKQAVAARQDTADRVSALANARLKSDLDRSFANVNLSQSQIMLLDAQNSAAEMMANLNALLGNTDPVSYQLVDQAAATLPAPSANVQDLIAKAFQSRPELRSLEDQYQASLHTQRAERDLMLPTISALAATGGTPVRVDQISPWYGAVGVNVSIPIFNGFAYSARSKAAQYQATAVQEKVRDLRNRIARDVTVTTLNAQSAYQKITVAKQLADQAKLALDLAQTRYQLGLGTIVELSQAQLQQTEAAIGYENAQYNYAAAVSALRYQTGQ